MIFYNLNPYVLLYLDKTLFIIMTTIVAYAI